MRIHFKGPEGSKFVGLNLRGIRPDKGKIRDLAAIQESTGWSMEDLNKRLTTQEMVTAQVVVFLSLRNAGMFVTWDEVGDFAQDEVEVVEEPGDRPAVEDPAEDPQTAPTDSARGAAASTAETTAPRKAASRGSRTRSALAS